MILTVLCISKDLDQVFNKSSPFTIQEHKKKPKDEKCDTSATIDETHNT